MKALEKILAAVLFFALLSTAALAQVPLFYSTLDDVNSVTTPVNGVGAGSVVSSGVTFVAGKTGNGAMFDASGDYIRLPVLSGIQNLEFANGTLEFWYKPSSVHTDDKEHVLFGAANSAGTTSYIVVRKKASNELWFEYYDSAGGNINYAILHPSRYSWAPGQWVRLKFTWELISGNWKFRIFVDGKEREYTRTTNLAPNTAQSETTSQYIFIGNAGPSGNHADGVIDDLRIYSVALPDTPFTAKTDIITLPQAAHAVGQQAGYYIDPDTGNKVYRLTDRTLCPNKGIHFYSKVHYFSVAGDVIVDCRPDTTNVNIKKYYIYDKNYVLLGDAIAMSNAKKNYRGLWWSTKDRVLYGTSGAIVWRLDPFNRTTTVWVNFSNTDITALNGTVKKINLVEFESSGDGIGPNDEILVKVTSPIPGLATYDPATGRTWSQEVQHYSFFDEADMMPDAGIWSRGNIGGSQSSVEVWNIDFTNLRTNFATGHRGFTTLSGNNHVLVTRGGAMPNCAGKLPRLYTPSEALWDATTNTQLATNINCYLPGSTAFDHFSVSTGYRGQGLDVWGADIYNTPGDLDSTLEQGIVKASIAFDQNGNPSVGFKLLARSRANYPSCGYAWAPFIASDFAGSRFLFHSNMAHKTWAGDEKTPGSCGANDVYVVEDNNPLAPSVAAFDHTPPTVSITSPAAGTAVSGTTTITASAADANGIYAVRFLLDGVQIGEGKTPPYTLTWDTTQVYDGAYTIAAQAQDMVTNRMTSSGVAITVSNGIAPPPPTTCSDGTPANSCSAAKPLYCSSQLQLADSCQQCGCPTGQQCDSTTNSCYIPQTCSDGTALDTCSAANPGKYCTSAATLINSCTACGCAAGQSCDATTGACYTPSTTQCSDGTTQSACSSTQPLYCDANLNLVNSCTQCGCPSNGQCDTGTGSCILAGNYNLLTFSGRLIKNNAQQTPCALCAITIGVLGVANTTTTAADGSFTLYLYRSISPGTYTFDITINDGSQTYKFLKRATIS